MTQNPSAMTKHIIVGTAGHIDHGKTTLIKTLTGVNTDRLAEEQERGISIVLGFAELRLPSGIQVGVVDVPGHEKFVRTMLSGAAGIDFVLFIIAADEGVMPQTVEHLEILQLLGLQHGLIVLTKVDMVDEEWLTLVTDDVQTFMKGTFLENAPLIPFSSKKGTGQAELLAAMDELAQRMTTRSEAGFARLPIDRVFTIQGIGTVVTGTLWSGQLRVGETVTVQPSGLTCKIRNIQVHERDSQAAMAGQRTAVALQGVDKQQVMPGQVVVSTAMLKPTYMLDVQLRCVKSLKKNIHNRQKVHFHHGTATVLGYVILLDREEAGPGDTVYAQMRLEEPIVVARGDRFVIRMYSPVVTIAGGVILDANPPKHKRFDAAALQLLERIEAGNVAEALSLLVAEARFCGLSPSEISRRFTLELEYLHDMIAARPDLVMADDRQFVVHETVFNEIKQQLLDKLQAFHAKFPLRIGAPPLEIQNELPPILPEAIFQKAVHDLIAAGNLRERESLIAGKDFQVSLTEQDQRRCREVLTYFDQAGLMPPFIDEIPLKIEPEILHYLLAEGNLVRINRTFILAGSALRRIQDFLRQYFAAQPELPVGIFRDQLGLSRKYAIPLLEYLDEHGLTRREGDIRYLPKNS